MNRYQLYASILDLPTEIIVFLFDVFDLQEIRGRVGKVQGVVFEVRSKETNHNIPHVHASYAEHNISIAIKDSRVLCGNLPAKQRKKAIKWISENKVYLQGKWSDLTLKREIPMTKSAINFE